MDSDFDMDTYCGSPFWNTTLTWDTDNPDFTPCFKRTVLVWIPCAFLWISLPYEIYLMKRSITRDPPMTLLKANKLTVVFVLAALTFTNVIRNLFLKTMVPPVEVITSAIQFFTHILFFALTWANMKTGIRSSGILFTFSLLLVIFGAPELRSEINSIQFPLKIESGQQVQFIYYILYYGTVLLIFVSNWFVDSKPKYTNESNERECPKNNASFVSKLYFCWFEPFVWKAYVSSSVQESDIWNLEPKYTSANIVPKFEEKWNATKKPIDTTAVKMNVQCAEDDDTGQIELRRSTEILRTSILQPLIKIHILPYCVVVFMICLENVFIFSSPLLLHLLLSFINGNEPSWKGYMYSILFLLATLGQSLIASHYTYIVQKIQLKVSSTLIDVVYKKTLRISSQVRKKFTTGQIVNLMSSDIEQFKPLIMGSSELWSAPIQIVGVFYYLWRILGLSAFSGVALIITFVPLNSYLASRLKNLQKLRLRYKDERIKIMNEILSGIKVLKLYAWELSFEKKIQNIRIKELRTLKKQIILNVVILLLWNIMPYVITLASFATYVYSGDDHILDAQKVFVSVALFNILSNPMTRLPQVISELMQTSVSVTRINKFLGAEELDSSAVTHEKKDEPLSIENGTFSWESPKGSPVLKNIDLKIKKGALVAIVGPVGSGKSSLLSAFLGETYKSSGNINTTGSIAYVPQLAWIRNTTLRENITLGRPVKQSFYNSILEACALNPDLKILPGGDLTEIGEKGINLSGGQKQRISLARAICADTDIYFLDDPLSAVDAHVGNHIFQHVLGPEGILNQKTRVMVTHGATFLTETDLIVVLKNGGISEVGTFTELLNNNQEFAEFLRNHSSEDAIESATNVQEIPIKSPTEPEKKASEEKSEQPKSSESAASVVKNEVTTKKLIEKEQVQTGYVTGKTYKHFLLSVGLLYPIATVLMYFGLQSVIVYSNIWLSKWTEDTEASNNGVQNAEKRNYYLQYYALFGVLQVLFGIIGNYVLFLGFLKTAVKMHVQLLDKVMRWPMRLFDVTPIGRILNRFGYDIDVIDYTLAMKISQLLLKLGLIISTFFIISYTTPVFIIVSIALFILFRTVQKFYLATSLPLRRLYSTSKSPIYSHFAETVVGLESIRAYNMQQCFEAISQEKVDFSQARFFTTIACGRWIGLRLEGIANLAVFFASLFSVINKHKLDAGLVGASVSYSLQITKSFAWLMRTMIEIESLMVSVERIKEYEDIPTEPPWEILPKKFTSDWPQKGEIIFDDYRLKYDSSSNLVLKGLTISIKGGEKIGIVGRTGAGKSSLALGLFRILEPTGGTIVIDGVDICSIGLHDLRSKLTIIPQDAVLFYGTLRINLDPFEEHSDDNLWHVLEQAHLKEYFANMPLGLQHGIDEGGVNLSVGQRQLICLARALLRKTKILILDEATAAIDLETDELIQATIRKEFLDYTVLTIAHRLNTIMDYDRILVLDHGCVEEFDSPQSLLKQINSTFFKMAREAALI